MKDESAKKGIMYFSGNDFYFFSYSILICLDALGCVSGRLMKDYRKLAFLIDFTTDRDVLKLIERYDERVVVNAVDREYLFNSYTNGLVRRGEVLKILFSLEAKGLVSLSRSATGMQIDVSLNREALPVGLLDKNLFKNEYENIKCSAKIIKRISSLKFETFISSVYGSRGVKTWAI